MQVYLELRLRASSKSQFLCTFDTLQMKQYSLKVLTKALTKAKAQTASETFLLRYLLKYPSKLKIEQLSNKPFVPATNYSFLLQALQPTQTDCPTLSCCLLLLRAIICSLLSFPTSLNLLVVTAQTLLLLELSSSEPRAYTPFQRSIQRCLQGVLEERRGKTRAQSSKVCTTVPGQCQ